MTNETNEYNDYLKDVIFINEDDDYKKLNDVYSDTLKKNIMEISFDKDTDYFNKAYKLILENIPNIDKTKDKWLSCAKDCYNFIEPYMINELKSTPYMLRLLTASVLGDTKNYKICFLVNSDIIKKITGKWISYKKNTYGLSEYDKDNSDQELFKIKIMTKKRT